MNYKLKENNPLVADGYAVLECPYCSKECYPDAKGLDGTVIYNLHKCNSAYRTSVTNLRFEIDINGDIVE